MKLKHTYWYHTDTQDVAVDGILVFVFVSRYVVFVPLGDVVEGTFGCRCLISVT